MLSITGLTYLSKIGLTEKDLAELLHAHPCPPHLVLGIIKTESSGNADALRFEPKYEYLYEPERFAKLHGWTVETEKSLQKFSYGLMQIMLAVARERGFNLHPKLLLIPKINLAWSCLHFWVLYGKYQNWMDAVAAYNFGHPAKKLLTNKYRNQEYVDRVYRHAAEFQRDDGPKVA